REERGGTRGRVPARGPRGRAERERQPEAEQRTRPVEAPGPERGPAPPVGDAGVDARERGQEDERGEGAERLAPGEGREPGEAEVEQRRPREETVARGEEHPAERGRAGDEPRSLRDGEEGPVEDLPHDHLGREHEDRGRGKGGALA